MKKLMIAAMMVLGTSAAFAGDSEALKAIMKAKTYAEAESLVKSGLNQLANNVEKATAYNKLVDLAMVTVSHEQSAMGNNQMVAQLGTGKMEPVDSAAYNQAVYDAIANGLECEKYDILPNEKGKAKAKFHAANQGRLYGLRVNLIASGQAAGDADKTTAFKHFSLYVESGKSSLFNEVDRTKNPDTYMGEVARVAAVYAFQNKDMDNANKYVDVAMSDPATYKEALNLKIFISSQGLKDKADSTKFAVTLQELYDKDPKNDVVFGQLAAVYQSLGEKEKAGKLIADRLASDPNNYTAIAMNSQSLMNTGKFDEAIAGFKKALSIKNDEPVIYAYLGFCINAKAAALQNDVEAKPLFTESLGYLEKCKQMDPNRERANWVYPLYQCYYSVYGPNDDRTKEMEALIK